MSSSIDGKTEQLQTEIDRYTDIVRREGYVVIPNVLSPEQIDTIKSELDPYSNKTGRTDFEGKLTRRVYGLLSKCPSIAPLVEHPLTTGVIDNFLVPNYHLLICQTADIHPGEKPQAIHADDDGGAPPRPRGPNGMGTMWALEDFTDANGGTRLIPGSHQWAQEQVDTATDEMTIGAEMKAGSVLLYQPHTLHGGGANRSNQVRRGVSILYCQPWLRSFETFLLSVPPEQACRYSKKVQQLLGYGTVDFIGQADGRDPIRWCEEAEARLKAEGRW